MTQGVWEPLTGMLHYFQQLAMFDLDPGRVLQQSILENAVVTPVADEERL